MARAAGFGRSENAVRLVSIHPEDINYVRDDHRLFLLKLFDHHGLLRGIHVKELFLAVTLSPERRRCILLQQTSPPEFTAANVFSWTWIFPLKDVQLTPALVAQILSGAERPKQRVEIVCDRSDTLRGLFSERLGEPVFWALTPRSELNSLRRSFREAFSQLIDRYPEHVIRGYIERKAAILD